VTTAPDDAVARLAVNTIKFLSIDAIEAAKSGHPGLPMGAADFAYVLWSRYLRHDPRDPHWPDRDRFVLSAGHGSMLLYSLLHLAGYDLPLDELKRFRQWGSKTPGHPEVHLTPGVEVTTGPLGQGFANAVGMGLAAKMAAARFPGLFSHRVWALVSDGDVQEGISHEAASLAGHLKLDNLIFVYDDNQVTLDGALDEAMSEDVGRRFEAYGWYVLHVDGHNHAQVAAAFDAAIASVGKPVLICARTTIGHGAPGKEGTHKAHGEPLGKDVALAAKRAVGWPESTPFFVPDEVRALFAARADAMAREHAAWREREAAWLTENAEQADLYRALGSIPVRYVGPLTLCYLEGLGLRETARVLALAPNTLKMRLHRGRALLRRRLTRLEGWRLHRRRDAAAGPAPADPRGPALPPPPRSPEDAPRRSTA
jgi:transketolase